jgi:hypothetical protein
VQAIGKFGRVRGDQKYLSAFIASFFCKHFALKLSILLQGIQLPSLPRKPRSLELPKKWKRTKVSGSDCISVGC